MYFEQDGLKVSSTQISPAVHAKDGLCHLLYRATTSEAVRIQREMRRGVLTYDPKTQNYSINGTTFTGRDTYISYIGLPFQCPFFNQLQLQPMPLIPASIYHNWLLTTKGIFKVTRNKIDDQHELTLVEDLEEDHDVIEKAQFSVGGNPSPVERNIAMTPVETHGAGSHTTPDVVTPEQFMDRFTHQQVYSLIMAIESELIKAVPEVVLGQNVVQVTTTTPVVVSGVILGLVQRRYLDAGWSDARIAMNAENRVLAQLQF